MSKLDSFKTGDGNPSFDLVRVSKSKERADVCPNTIRAYAEDGLNLYRCGKAVFFSLSELAAFIRVRGQKQITREAA